LIEPRKPSLYQSQNADLAMSQVLEMFAHPMPVFSVDIHPTVVDPAVIGSGAKNRRLLLHWS
jgi:UDP-3-O-[3-hydroxymyristoyl] glucosamine N-acyltransferase